MSLFDLQDVCIAIGSLATLDLSMVVDLIGIYVLKGPYCTLTMTNWFLQALSVIPRGSWGDVARRFTMIRWLQFAEPYLLRLPTVDSSDKSESGSVGLLLLRRFVWISISNVCLKLLLHLHTHIILLSSVLLAVPVLLIEEHQDAVFEDERVVPVYLRGRAAVPVLLIEEHQDAVFEDERVVPVYLRGRAGNSRIPLLPAGFVSHYELIYELKNRGKAVDNNELKIEQICRQQWIEELSLFQILKTTKKTAKERTQRTIPVGTLQNTFEREDFVSNGLNLNRGYIFEKNAIEEVDCWLEITRALLQKYVDCTVLQQRENEPEAKLSTIILEKA
ncbi:hypothetical protein F511_24408 [Dorcoceras hygrometricum]|uniref:Uncharacterized protein n=1 Tax=Dorcoceras hygrometricum TaxID=472368 RepID=A0A2Z7C9W3_9LAMI|nr:hypothetical protein F511_24408 [Dorcoceras hygrometricum]